MIRRAEISWRVRHFLADAFEVGREGVRADENVRESVSIDTGTISVGRRRSDRQDV